MVELWIANNLEENCRVVWKFDYIVVGKPGSLDSHYVNNTEKVLHNSSLGKEISEQNFEDMI